MGTPVSFHSLNYEQFMAGELCTIMNCTSSSERKGRVTLLQKISNWKMMVSASWPQIRSTYAHILHKIENKEIKWDTDFDRFERHIFDKVAVLPKNKPERKKAITAIDWFCKQFQKPEGCKLDAPHQAQVGNQIKTVQHFCASCWLKDRTSKKPHSESSPDCPLRE